MALQDPQLPSNFPGKIVELVKKHGLCCASLMLLIYVITGEKLPL